MDKGNPMIITCEKCSTSFNLDDTLVKENGSKVRCSVCKVVFTAFPPTAEQSTPVAPVAPLPDESSIEDTSTDFDEMQDNEFDLSDDDLSIEEETLDSDSFDFGDDALPAADLTQKTGDLDLEIEPEDSIFEIEEDDIEEEPVFEIETEEISEEDIGYEIEEDEPEFELSMEEDPENPDDMDDYAMPEDTDSEDQPMDDLEYEPMVQDDDLVDDLTTQDSDDQEEDFELEFEVRGDDDAEEEETVPETDPPLLTPEDDFSEYDKVLEQETDPDDEILEEETIEIDDTEEEKPKKEKKEPDMDMPRHARRRKKQSSIGAPILIFLLLFLLVASAYVASIMTGYKIPYLSDIKIPMIEEKLKQYMPTPTEVIPAPNQKSVKGRFVTNTNAGNLFVITGNVENNSTVVYSHILVKGTLLLKENVEAKVKSVFCGNIITEDMLKTGKLEDIEKLLMVKQGGHDTNVNIKPGSKVPFMVVFSDLPEELQNYRVTVTEFEKVEPTP